MTSHSEDWTPDHRTQKCGDTAHLLKSAFDTNFFNQPKAPMFQLSLTSLRVAANALTIQCHGAALDAGWWNSGPSGELETCRMAAGEKPERRIVQEKLCLIHSEISEAMEGHRKDKTDEHLPHRISLEVELADAVIRIFDLSGGMGLDVAGAIAEKMAYNAIRADHQPDNRRAAGGKAF